MTSFRTYGALAALTLALLAAPALAQAPDAGAGRHGQDHQRMEAMMQQHRAEKSHDLHTILAIRPDEEAAFSAFESSMAPPPRSDHEPKDRQAFEAMTTPQRLDRMLAKMAEHTARMRQHIEAVKTFYAALSPEQQHVFDALGRMHGGHGGHGGGMMHGPGEGPPPAGE